MADVLRLLASAPSAIKLISALQAAQKGDAEARAYLLREGWADAAEIAVPGGGELAKKVATTVQEYIQQQRGDVVDGEYRVLDSLPWSGFVGRLFRQHSGGHIIMGPPGSGKTEIAKKLAYQWHKHLGYKVDACSMYREDLPDFANIIDVDTLVRRMKRLQRYLRSLSVRDEEDEEDEEDGKEEAGPATPPPGDRVVIIDEAGLSMSNTATDPGRRASLQALAQSRHLRWHVLYLAQWTGQLPLPLLGQSCTWIKRPAGDEKDTDRDNRRVRELWLAAEEAFKGLRNSPFYQPPHDDWRAWAYVDCKTLNGQPGYTGMIPFSMYQPGGQ